MSLIGVFHRYTYIFHGYSGISVVFRYFGDSCDRYHLSTPLYDGSPSITSMIKAVVINKYNQVCKKKERKKKKTDDFVVISTSAGFS